MINKININLSKHLLSYWKIKKYDEPFQNYYIISICFFIKYEGYIDKYVVGLTNIINKFILVLPNYRLRIYHDNTTLDIINDILKTISNNNIINNIELYEYDIPILREENNKLYHKGTIGTIIRFLPLFDFKYHKVDKCIILDIDSNFSDKVINTIKYLDNNNIIFAYHSRLCNKLFPRIICINKKNNIYTNIMAGFIYQSINLPYKILSKFLEKLYIKNNHKLVNLIINKCKISNIYEYGIDEIFLNKYYLKYFYKKKIDIMIILLVSDIIPGFNKILNIYVNNDEIYNHIWNFLLTFLKICNLNTNLDNIETIYTNKKNERFILSQFKNKDIRNNLIKLINEELNIQNIKKIKYYDILLNCTLNTIKHINPYYKINMLKIKTNYYKKKYINEDIIHIKSN
jgi:hypothetical protein